jgi:hypothetical protein
MIKNSIYPYVCDIYLLQLFVTLRQITVVNTRAIVKMCKITVTGIINKKKTRYQRKLINMNKLQLFAIFLLSVIIIQSCKKENETAVAYSTAPLQANIDGSTWAPDTLSTSITYNSATKTKVLNISGTKNTRQVILSVTLNNAPSTAGFLVNTFNIDSLAVVAQYNTQQKDALGNYVFMPQGAVSPGAGTITVTAVDSVKKLITGKFSFYSRTVTYDASGVVTSINVNNIYGGAFNSLPYTFISN